MPPSFPPHRFSQASLPPRSSPPLPRRSQTALAPPGQLPLPRAETIPSLREEPTSTPRRPARRPRPPPLYGPPLFPVGGGARGLQRDARSQIPPTHVPTRGKTIWSYPPRPHHRKPLYPMGREGSLVTPPLPPPPLSTRLPLLRTHPLPTRPFRALAIRAALITSSDDTSA